MRRGRWLAFVSAVATAVVVGVFTAGSASAATSVTCTDSASDQATLQNAINGGGTVLVHGTCLGNWTIANQVTLTGVGGAKLLERAGPCALPIDTTSTGDDQHADDLRRKRRFRWRSGRVRVLDPSSSMTSKIVGLTPPTRRVAAWRQTSTRS